MEALRAMLAADPACRQADGYQFDVVNLTRQALGNYALTLHQKMAEDYGKKDIAALRAHGAKFMEVGRDITTLLATRHEFLLGPYLCDARAWGTDEAEKDYYERNARQIVSTWTVKPTGLTDYASRQNDGQLATYYLPRWEEFLKRVEASLVENKPYDAGPFNRWCAEFELKWTETRGCDLPLVPQGEAYTTASRLVEKYRTVLP